MTPARRNALFRSLLRLTVLLVVIVAINLALNQLLGALEKAATPQDRLTLDLVLLACLVIYAVLLAIPFVPSIEIGMSLLMMQGASIAPFVYAGTVSGLFLAYFVGKRLPYRYLRSFFTDLGLVSASRLLERIDPLDRAERLALLHDSLPRWLGVRLVRYRYLTLAAVLNIPGNAIVGGGGGIAMIAGLSGMFSTRYTVLTLALAVAPVPILVYVFGLDATRFLEF